MSGIAMVDEIHEMIERGYTVTVRRAGVPRGPWDHDETTAQFYEDPERVWMALAEVGLEPEGSHGSEPSAFMWDRAFTLDEVDLITKAIKLAR